MLALLLTGHDCWAASGCTTAIANDFNSLPIAAGSVIWFNSVLSLSGLHSGGARVNFDDVTISFSAGGTTYTLSVPGATVTVSPTATSATTIFDATTGRWETIAPAGLAGNIFLDGLAFPVPTDLPGTIKPVTWSGQFSSDTPGVTIQWQWAAAVYTTFGSDNDSLGVKPVDDKRASTYQNLDPAGTPENFKTFVTGGATGKGGSNFTGSSSVHVVVTGCPLCNTAADCDDGDPCTADTCDPQAGCVHTPIMGCSTTTTTPSSTTTTSSVTTTTSAVTTTTSAATTTTSLVTTTTGVGTTTTSLATTTTTLVETTTTTSTTVAPTTTTATTSSTTTTLTQPSTTTLSSTTTTTLPREVCGHCQYHTGAGLVDFEDPACCGESTPLGVRTLMLQSKAAVRRGRLRVDAIYAPTVPPLFDPLTQDTSVQIRDSSGELVCLTLSADHWEHPHLGVYRFRNKGGTSTAGLSEARFIVTHSAKVIFHASGRAALGTIDGTEMMVTVRVGNVCGHSTLDLRSRRKALVFP